MIELILSPATTRGTHQSHGGIHLRNAHAELGPKTLSWQRVLAAVLAVTLLLLFLLVDICLTRGNGTRPDCRRKGKASELTNGEKPPIHSKAPEGRRIIAPGKFAKANATRGYLIQKTPHFPAPPGERREYPFLT